MRNYENNYVPHHQQEIAKSWVENKFVEIKYFDINEKNKILLLWSIFTILETFSVEIYST